MGKSTTILVIFRSEKVTLRRDAASERDESEREREREAISAPL